MREIRIISISISIITIVAAILATAFVFVGRAAAASIRIDQGYLLARPTAISGLILVCSSTAYDKRHCDYTASGVADNVPIQAALNLGAYTVQLSDGNFNLSAGITIPQGATLQGIPDGTQLTAAAGCNCDLVTLSSPYATLRWLKLDGNKTNQSSGRGIVLTSAVPISFDGAIEQVKVRNFKGDGIYVGNNIMDARFRNVFSESNGGDGVNLNGSDSSLIGVESRTNDGNGFLATGTGHYLGGIIAAGNGQNGLNFGAWRSEISGSFVDLNALHGIYLSGNYNTLTGGQVANNNKVASYYQGVAVTGNYNRVIGLRIGADGTAQYQHQFNVYVGSGATSNIVLGNTALTGGASLGNILDAGTGTLIRSNVGIIDN